VPIRAAGDFRKVSLSLRMQGCVFLVVRKDSGLFAILGSDGGEMTCVSQRFIKPIGKGNRGGQLCGHPGRVSMRGCRRWGTRLDDLEDFWEGRRRFHAQLPRHLFEALLGLSPIRPSVVSPVWVDVTV